MTENMWHAAAITRMMQEHMYDVIHHSVQWVLSEQDQDLSLQRVVVLVRRYLSG